MVNEVILLGRLTADPEVLCFENNSKIAKFTLATSEIYKTKSGEKKELTQFHRILIYGNQSEIAEKYVKKGHLLYVSGQLNYGSYVNKEGQTVYTTEIVVRPYHGYIKLMPNNRINNQSTQSQNQNSNDDILF